MPDTLVRPAYSWVPPTRSSNGDIAAEVGAQLGWTPDPNQRAILDAIYAENTAGVPACYSVCVVAPRQNLKSSVYIIAALADIFVFGEERVIWTAHKYDTAIDSFQKMVKLIRRNPDFYRRLAKEPKTANGQESIELSSGERIEFHARAKGAGRGLDAAKIVMDEALYLRSGDMGNLLPTTATMPTAQIRYASSSGKIESDELRRLRDRGRKGGEGRLSYFEWSSERRECAHASCSHVLGVEGCALDDRELWGQANPALGDRITVERLEDFRRELPADEFAREFLGWWDDPPNLGGIFDPELWLELADLDSTVPNGPVFAVDVNPERTWTSIAVSGRRPDGLLHGAVVDRRQGTEWVRAELTARDNNQPKYPGRIVVMANSPAAALDLSGCNVEVMSRAEYVSGCQGFHDLVTSRGLRYRPDVDLNAALAGAVKQNVGTEGAWCWSRKGLVDISPLVSTTLAVTLAARTPVGQGRVLVFD